jgi:lipopolysaccharide transport system permease protein
MISRVENYAERLHFKSELLFGMVRRDVLGRYRESLFGLIWSLLSPLFLLAVYTLAFHEVFGARWPGAESRSGFAVMAFVGLILHGLLAETLMRAPTTISGQANFVKKLVFPLTVLPLVPLGSAFFHAVIGLAVLVGFTLVSGPALHWTGLLVPLVLLPYMLGLCGLAWASAAIGVYIRDIVQLAGLVSTAFMFLSPVFYPLSTIPAKYAGRINLNPLTFVIESVRGLMFDGVVPDLSNLAIYTLASAIFAWLGLMIFRRLRAGFGDVL